MRLGARTIRRDLLLVLGLTSFLALASTLFGLLLIRRNTRLVEQVFADYLALSRCSEQVLVAQSEATGCMSRALSLRGPEGAVEIAGLRSRFVASAHRASTFLNAMIWGSESEAFARGAGGALAAAWHAQGAGQAPVVQPAPPALRQLAGLSDIYYAAFARRVLQVLDTCGSALASEGTVPDPTAARGALEPSIREAYEFRRLSTEMLQEVVQRVHGDLRAAAADVRRAQNLAAGLLLTVSLLAGAISVGFGWVFATVSIVRPLERLRAGTAVVGAGDLDYRVGTTAPDEIGQLSRAFDAMVENLQSVMARRDDLDREVAQRQRAEADLVRALDDLKRSNTDLEQFAYAASHDLQEPLRKISAFGSLLEKENGPELTGSGPLYVASMCKAAVRMQNLINALLMYSRVTTRGKEFVQVDLNEVLAEVLTDLEWRLRETGGTVTAGPLPRLDADPTQMRQLLQNLVANALKFRRPDTAPQVEVREVASGEVLPDAADCPPPKTECCRLVVRDNGIGFEPRYAERIFGVFQRLHPQHQYEGSGIGLSLCRRIAERHGGTIRAFSRPGVGSAFVVDLRRQATSASGPGPD